MVDPGPAVPETADSHVDLDVVGAILGADKSSVVTHAWDYLRHYEAVLAPLRDRAFNLIEVGVKSGISLKLWEWYFPHANITGIDIDPKCLEFARPRVQIAIGSQTDAAFLRSVCQAHKPTVFIDDGSHRANHIIFTFETVFPLIRPGGIYVIEDLGFHFGPGAPMWQGSEPRNVIEYVLDLARSCLARQIMPGAETVAAGIPKLIDSVQIIGSAAIIRRRYAGREVEQAVATGLKYIDTYAPGAAGNLHFACLILRQGGDLATARAACERAIASGEVSTLAYVTLGDITLRLGDRQAARAALSQAAATPTNRLQVLRNLASLQEKVGMIDAAVTTLQALLALFPEHAGARQRLAALSAG